jgi:hypothetical protein
MFIPPQMYLELFVKELNCDWPTNTTLCPRTNQPSSGSFF